MISSSASADSVMTTIPMTDSSTGNPGTPGFSTINPNTDMIYVAVQVVPHQGVAPYGWVAVINGSTDSVVSEIPLTGSLGGIAANSATGKIYADDGNGIEVIDGISNSIVGTIPVSCTGYVAVNSNTNEIYVSDQFGSSECVVNGTTKIPLILACVGVNTNTDMVYGCGGDSIAIINGNTDTVTSSLQISSGVSYLAANPVTNKVYVSSGYPYTIVVVQGSSSTSTVP